MQNKIAIVGSDSFLATYLIRELTGSNLLVRYSRRSLTGVGKHILFSYPEVPLNMSSLLECNHVVYCAGSGIQVAKHDFIYQLNTYTPIEIANYLNDNSFAGKFVTFGSYAEIGNNVAEIAFNEEDLIRSLLPVPNSYAVSKRLLSRFFNGANLSLSCYHLILPTIYGKGENPNRLLPYLTSCLSDKQIPILTNGLQVRQYVHVKDVAALIHKILKSDIIAPGIYNIPCKETCTVRDIVKLVYEEFELADAPVSELRQRFDESMKYLELDASKMTKAFPDWVPTISVRESIREYLI